MHSRVHYEITKTLFLVSTEHSGRATRRRGAALEIIQQKTDRNAGSTENKESYASSPDRPIQFRSCESLFPRPSHLHDTIPLWRVARAGGRGSGSSLLPRLWRKAAVGSVVTSQPWGVMATISPSELLRCRRMASGRWGSPRAATRRLAGGIISVCVARAVTARMVWRMAIGGGGVRGSRVSAPRS